MLQSIRDHTQGWIAGIIISLLVLSFALWGIHSYFEGGGGSNVVAKVNGVDISKGQLAVAYERLRRQLQIQFSGNYQLPERAEANLKDRALQTLISIQVLKQASLEENYRISSAQIDSYLESIPDFQVNGEFSLERFQQVLNTTLFNAGDFLDLIKTTLLIDQPRLGIIFTSFAVPNEVNTAIALVGQERNVAYAVIPKASVIKQPIIISDDAAHSYYDQHQNEFKTPEQVSLQYLELSVKDLSGAIQPTEDALKSFYTENSNTFVQPAQWKLDMVSLPLAANASNQEVTKAQETMAEIAKLAVSGKDFAGLAQQFSATRDDKRLQIWVNINQIPSELQKDIVNLTRVGQVSSPVRTAKGFVIVKVVGYKEAQVQPYEKVKDKVKETYARQHAEEKFGDMREKLANLTYEHPESLADAAKELGLTVKTTDLFTKEKASKESIASNAKVREAAFSNDVLNLQNNSDVIQTGPDSAMVVRVKSHVPAALLTFETVKQQIIDKLKANELEVRIKNLSNEVSQKLQSGALTPEQVKAQYNVAWVNAGFIGRHTAKIDPAILNIAFEMPAPQNGKSTYATTKVSDGYAIVGLSAIKAGVVESKEQYRVFAEQVQNSGGLLEYELYKNSLMKRAKITKE